MSESSANSAAEDARYELFIERFTRHESDLRAFIRSLLPPWGDADEVTQLTALVIWRKFDLYDPDTNFMKWACVIARFEALAFRRKMGRDRLVFRDDIYELMAEEGVEELKQRAEERGALESCLGILSEQQRHFVMLAHTSGVKVAELAKEAGSTPSAFYMRLNRLRRKLMHCIEAKTKLGNV